MEDFGPDAYALLLARLQAVEADRDAAVEAARKEQEARVEAEAQQSRAKAEVQQLRALLAEQQGALHPGKMVRFLLANVQDRSLFMQDRPHPHPQTLDQLRNATIQTRKGLKKFDPDPDPDDRDKLGALNIPMSKLAEPLQKGGSIMTQGPEQHDKTIVVSGVRQLKCMLYACSPSCCPRIPPRPSSHGLRTSPCPPAVDRIPPAARTHRSHYQRCLH